jgi:hypothetical protein
MTVSAAKRYVDRDRGLPPRRVIRVAAVLLLVLLCSAVGAASAQAEPSAASGCPDGGYAGVPGQRIKTPTSAAVYMVDPEGRRRLIPDRYTYEHFFRDWSGIITTADALCVYPGPALELAFDFLAKSSSGPAVYFADAVGNSHQARWIPSAAVFDRYHFRWGAVGVADQEWIDSHAGPNWT